MEIRKMKLPQDIDAVAEVSLTAFQYPDNPEWSIQEDEAEELRDQLKAIKRYWPLLRVAGLFSPTVRHLFAGYVCEEDGEIIGTVMHQRNRRTEIVYYINDVAVHPNQRRRGIARKLVETALDEMRSSGAKKVMLDVIDGNLPAYRLYEKLGWQHFSGSVHLDMEGVPQNEVPLPEGFELVEIAPSEWRTFFQFNQHVTPQSVQRFDPVEEVRFREGWIMRFLESLTGTKQKKAALRSKKDGQIVAVYDCHYRTRPGGSNHARLMVDPAYLQVSPYWVDHVTRRVQQLAPDRKLELVIYSWQPDLVTTAQEAGFSRRLEYHKMGLLLN